MEGREREVVLLKERLSGLEEFDPEGAMQETVSVRKQLQTASSRVDSVETELDRVTRDRARATMALRRAEEEVSVLRRDVEVGVGEMAKLREEVTQYRETCDFLEQGKSRAEAEREHLRSLLSQESASVGVRTEAAGNLEREIERLIGRTAELESMLEGERRRRDDVESREGIAQDEISRFAIEIRTLKDIKVDLEGRLSRMGNELAESRSVVSSVQGELASCRAECNRERASRSAAEVREGQQKNVAREERERHSQLKSLFGQLERTREGLLNKLELTAGEVRCRRRRRCLVVLVV